MTSTRRLPPIPALAALALLTGCSPAPLPPRAEVVPSLSPSPSASVSASPSAAPVASAAEPAAPPAPREKASEEDDPTRGGTRLPLEDGAALLIKVGEPSAPGAVPDVTLTLSRGGEVVGQREGFAAVTGVSPKVLTSAQPCESCFAGIRRESFGSVAGVRVSLVCKAGEDYSSGTELAVLFRLDGPLRDLDGLTRIWAGLGDGLQNEMDSCSIWRNVTFEVVNAKTLEKTSTTVGSWTDQEIDGALKARLKKKCKVGTSKRVERIALP